MLSGVVRSINRWAKIPWDQRVAACRWMECGQVGPDSVVLPISTDIPFVPEDSSDHG